jgi:hypothetical protein
MSSEDSFFRNLYLDKEEADPVALDPRHKNADHKSDDFIVELIGYYCKTLDI